MCENQQTLMIPIELTQEDRLLTASLCLSRMSLENLIAKEKEESVLHHKEKEYFETLRFDRRKASYLMGRYCAKKALNHLLKGQKMNSILIRSGVFGQPIVRTSTGIQVSISHSEDLGCALAFDEEYPMAIDLETIDLERSKVINDQLTPPERELLQAQWDKKAGSQYTWIWTVKEALSKVLKTGLTTPMSIYEVCEFAYEDPYIIAKYKNFTQYKTVSFFWKHAVCSITLPKQTKICMFNLKPFTG